MTVAVCTFLLAVAVALLACGDSTADTDAIRSLVSREVAAINGRDLRVLSEIWSKDKNALLFDVPPPGRFEGWDQIGRLWRDFFDRVTDIQLTVEAVRVEAHGSLGYATYDWAMTGRLGSYPLVDRGQATAIYHKEGGSWKLVHAHYSPVPPALAGLAAPEGGASPVSSPSPQPGATAPAGGTAAHAGSAVPKGQPTPRPGAAAPTGSPQPRAPAPAGTPSPSASPAGATGTPPVAPGHSR
jgi:ketosteroid isomerase-like protein